MIQFLCERCTQNTVDPTIIRYKKKVIVQEVPVLVEPVQIAVEDATKTVMDLLDSGKNSLEISEITGLSLRNVNQLIITKRLKDPD